MELDHVFGMRGDLKSNIHYLDETNVLYPCGHVVVIYNLETKTQRFIYGSERSGGICALAVSSNKKLVAVAERSERPIVTVYDIGTLRKRKSLVCSDIHSREVVNVVFSNDNKQILVQGASPDWTMMCWAWEKSKVLVTTKASNAQGNTVTFSDYCPWDVSIIIVIGDGLLRFIKIQDGAPKPLPFAFKREVQQYQCHTWLPEERLLVATDTGELLLFENFEFRGTLSFLKQDAEQNEMAAIDSLVSYNKGFVCGGARSTLYVFEQSEDPYEYYRHVKTFAIDGKASRVTNLAISPSEDNMACSLANSQTYVLGLGNTDILKAEEMSFEPLTTSVHGPFQVEGKSTGLVGLPQRAPGGGGLCDGSGSGDGPWDSSCRITGLDVCMRKPLVATCGVDRSLRVWNYVEKSLVMLRDFSEMPLSLTFHPSGLHILVGFSDKLRLMNILMDDIRPYKEVPIKSCRECQFSNGGQYFAAANGNVVQIFQTYTFECIMTLRGHAGRVQSIAWSSDDRVLVTSGADGMLYRWHAKDGRKEGDYTCKGSSLTGAACADMDGDVALCVGKPDISLREVNMLTGRVKYELAGLAGMGFEQVVMSNSGRSVFTSMYDMAASSGAGSTTGKTKSRSSTAGLGDRVIGSITMLTLPLSSNSQASDKGNSGGMEDGDEEEEKAGGLHQLGGMGMGSNSGSSTAKSGELGNEKLKRSSVHAGSVTRMVSSHDDTYLFTAGEDGTLAIYRVTEASENGAGARKSREKEMPMQFAEEILVTKADMEEKTSVMNELKNKVDELTLHNEYQLRLKDMNYNERIKDVTQRFTDELDADKKKYEKLKTEKDAMETMFKDRLERLAVQHEDQVKGVNRSYQDKIDAEVQRYDHLTLEREQMVLRWDEQNQLLVESHEKYVNEVTEDFELKLSSELKDREQIDKTKQKLIKQFEDSKQEVEEDADLEIEELKEKYVAKLAVERESTLRLKGENGIMKTKFTALQHDIEEQKVRIKQLTERETDLYERIKGLEKDIHGHTKEIKEREETIQDKEKRIYDLKKKNQELEKFKFVLDYKIKELKRQIEPRENEITDMRQQIKEMDLELEQYQKSNAALDLMIGELRLKIEGMQKEIDQQNEALREGKLAADHCRAQLHEAVKSLNEPVVLKQKVVAMYKKYVQEKHHLEKQAALPGASKGGSGSTNKKDAAQAAGNVQREYNRQREYLEKSVESLKRKLAKDMKMHQADKMRLLRESVDLTNEINILRREFHMYNRRIKSNQSNVLGIMDQFVSQSRDEDTQSLSSQQSAASKEIELQRQQIQQLTQQVNMTEKELGLK